MLEETRSLVRKCGLTYDEICAGAQVGKSWLEKFMADSFDDYGIRRVTRLREYLVGVASADAGSGTVSMSIAVHSKAA